MTRRTILLYLILCILLALMVSAWTAPFAQDAPPGEPGAALLISIGLGSAAYLLSSFVQLLKLGFSALDKRPPFDNFYLVLYATLAVIVYLVAVLSPALSFLPDTGALNQYFTAAQEPLEHVVALASLILTGPFVAHQVNRHVVARIAGASASSA